jgi:tRNA modification GTPase
MASRLDELAGQIDAARRRLREGALLHEGALVVLAGPPNAGKSSLLNALLGENRAIVSPTAGTTRDAIEAWADFGGWPVRLVDTAGLRETSDAVEAEGVARAEALVARADVVVALGGARGTIAVHAKCDLGHGPGLNVSAVTGEGLDDLKRAIVAALEEKVAQGGALAEAAGERRRQIDSALAAARATLAEGAPHACDLVLLGNVARRAAGILGELVGAEYSADLLDRLFSRFCVGK